MRTLVQKTEAFLEWGGIKKEITLLAISGVALVVSIFDLLPLPFDAAWVAIVLCGIPIVLEALIGLITAFDIKADVLVSLALIAAVLIGEDFAAGEVAFIMQLGALLEDVTVARARAGIEKLVHLTPQTARLLLPDGENIVPAGQVRVGDRLRVLPGESIPVDGVITSGQTSINQAVMTGESLPVDKTVGDEVSSGTVNQYGAFEMRATKVGEDSSIQRMIRLVQSADAGKARIVGLADRWATWIVVIALTAAALTWLVTGEIIRAVTILVVWGFTDNLIAVFNSENNQQLLDYAHVGLRIYFLGFLFAGINIMLVAYFSAVDRAVPAITGSLMRGVIAIAISAVILSRLFGINGVWSSFLSSEIITFVVLLVLAKAGEKRGLKNEI